jgi:hypothetical protein
MENKSLKALPMIRPERLQEAADIINGNFKYLIIR